MNAILQQWVQPYNINTNTNNTSPHKYPSENENSTLNLEDLKKEMMKIATEPIHIAHKTKGKKHKAQGTDNDGTEVTYCWSHGITKNLSHACKKCRRKKEVHQDSATLSNKIHGYTDR